MSQLLKPQKPIHVCPRVERLEKQQQKEKLIQRKQSERRKRTQPRHEKERSMLRALLLRRLEE